MWNLLGRDSATKVLCSKTPAQGRGGFDASSLKRLKVCIAPVAQKPGSRIARRTDACARRRCQHGHLHVIENVLLRPLPYAHSDRLLYIGPAGKPGFGTTSW